MVRPILAAALAAALPAASAAQMTPQQLANAPLPSELELNKLVWTTIAAVDHANKSGNYSVVRDLAAPGFQMANDPAKLTQIFAGLRASNTDLSNALLLAPTWRSQPRMVQADMLQLQGFFGLRPTAISFEFLFQWTGGRWRLFGVAINPAQISPVQPGGPAPQQPAPTQPPRKRN